MINDLCFEIIQKCPNNCIFCSSNSNYDRKDIIDFETFKNTINFFCDNGGIKEISLSGGEPLLHPQIIEIIEFCKEKNIYITLYTSGIMLNNLDIKDMKFDNEYIKKIIEDKAKEKFSCIPLKVFERLKKAGLDKVVFDMQAAEVDEYNYLMGTKNNFINLLDSMRYATKAGLDTSIHFVPNKINVSQFEDVYEIAELAGINEVRLLKFVPQGRGKDNKRDLQLSEEELKLFIEKCNSIKQGNTVLKVGIPLQSENNHLCTAGFDKLVVRYDGVLLPCPAFKDIDASLLEKKGFKKISIYSNLNDFRFINGVRKTPLCQQIKR